MAAFPKLERLDFCSSADTWGGNLSDGEKLAMEKIALVKATAGKSSLRGARFRFKGVHWELDPTGLWKPYDDQ